MPFGQDSPNQATRGWPIGGDAHDVGAAPYLLVELVADLSLEVHRLKKTAIPMPRDGVGTSDERRAEGDHPGRSSLLHLPKRQALRDLGVPKSTYYRWLNRHRLDDRPGGGPTPWNRLSPEDEQAVLTAARQSVELSCRQLAAWLTDSKGVSVSTVYRILRRKGLVKSPEMQLKAGKEYHRKTSRPHQMWATDASYFRVIGWGFYYLVTVMDDYSRFILAHKLCAQHHRHRRSHGRRHRLLFPDRAVKTQGLEKRCESLLPVKDEPLSLAIR